MKIKEFFSTGLSLKITSFIMACTIWFYAVTEEKIEINIKTGVVIPDLTSELILSSSNIDSFEIVYRGKRRDFLFMNLLKKNPVIKIEGERLSYGNYENAVNSENIIFPLFTDIRIVRVSLPDTFYFTVDSIGEKDVNVIPNITGSPQNGYTVSGDITAYPNKIKIIGGKRILNEINSVATETVSIANTKKSISKKVDPILGSPFLTSSSKKIEVKIPVEKSIKKTFSSIPVLFINKNRFVKINPDSVTVTIEVSGAESAVNSLLGGELSPVIDISNINKRGDYTIRITPPSSKFLTVISIIPPEIKVTAK